MSKTYMKLVVEVDCGLAEGVYMQSGCYTVTANIHQSPQTGRGDYRIQVNGSHSADHTNDKQWLVIVFNQAVVYKSSNGTLVSGDGTNTLTIEYSYHQNPNDNIGLGDLCVESDAGLQIISANITD